MLATLIRMIVIGIFGLLGFLDLLVLKDATHDLIHKNKLDHLTNWSRQILMELVHRYNQSQNSLFEDLMPTVLELILIITFYMAQDLIITDILIAILIFTDGIELRNHFEKIPPFSIRAVFKYQKSTNHKHRYSNLFLIAIITQTLMSIIFMILPYLFILIRI